MRRFPWSLFSCSIALLTGCEQAVRAPIPSLDATAPTETQTATFALG
jgi:hypothetical protein